MENKTKCLSAGLRTVCRYAFLAITLITGLILLVMGFKLMRLGGSSFYFGAGVAYLIMVALYLARHRAGLWLSVITFIATVVWAFAEAGLSYWQLLPRLVVPALIFMLSLFTASQLKGFLHSRVPSVANGVAVGVFAALLATLVAAFFPHGVIRNTVEIEQDPVLAKANSQNPENWQFFGRSENATQFAPYSEITPENVDKLKVAWIYRSGRPLKGNDANTLQQIGSVMYTCSPTNIVSALDVDTGKELWKFDPGITQTNSHITCRGVGYHDSTASDVAALQPAVDAVPASANSSGMCQQRVLVNTIDARLFALDAHTGQLCEDFGVNGFVNLSEGMGDTQEGRFYHPTAAPTVVGNLVVIGGWSMDIAPTSLPGVVRAFNALDGSLVWAWDPANPENKQAPEPGKTYTLGTPNAWGPMSFDKELGLLYVPTGNAPTDYWGGHRTQAGEKFGSSVVALDLQTGEVRWSFQLVHHDVWDYDTPSQPTLYTLKNKQGIDVPVLIQTSKSGQIFVLDRRTGEPVYDVVEKPVPQNALEGERLSPTQPFSVELPAIGNDLLTEEKMWGISTFDQLWCRIAFKESVYHGIFTAPSEQPYIQWPGLLGSLNWGGITIDESRGLAFVNSIELAQRLSMKRRDDPSVTTYDYNSGTVPTFIGSVRPQDSGPYGGLRIDHFQSPIAVPCTRPPFGTMTAIDLKSKKLVWQVPLGTVEELGPTFFGKSIKVGLPMEVGMPSVAGSTATASGLLFFAGTQDKYIRAFNSLTGEEVWRERLPLGSAATPIVYRSPVTGKQYVAVSAGGIRDAKEQGDYIIAYTLDDE